MTDHDRRPSTPETPVPLLTVLATPTPELEAHVLEWAAYLAEFHDDVVVRYNDVTYRITAALTPVWLIEKARRVLGGIHMDPASSPLANQRVRAEVIFTRDEDGLARPWKGPLFLSPPGGYNGQVQLRWWNKLLYDWASKWNTPEAWSAIFVGFNASNWASVKDGTTIRARRLPVRFDLHHGAPSEAEAKAIVICLSTDPEVRARFAEEFPP